MDKQNDEDNQQFALSLLENSSKFEHESEKDMLQQSDRLLQVIAIIVAIAAIAFSDVISALKSEELIKWLTLSSAGCTILSAGFAFLSQFNAVQNPYLDPNCIISHTNKGKIDTSDLVFQNALAGKYLLTYYESLKRSNKRRKSLLRISRLFLLLSIVLIGVISIVLVFL